MLVLMCIRMSFSEGVSVYSKMFVYISVYGNVYYEPLLLDSVL